MKLFNTLSRNLEQFVPINNKHVNMYVCGPTVYDFIHIGNARPMVIFDCLRNYLIYRGFDVVYVQNFTDVDDKIINKAISQNVSFNEIVSRYIAEYEIDANGLLVSRPTFAPRVSENIDSIIEMISKLIAKGHAYEANGDVIFKTSSFKNYGMLSRMNLSNLQAGKRIAVDSSKETNYDFILWKSAKPNEPYWNSPWGNGRPGWHIECSVMASKFASPTLDIHCGGQDLIFPHHENEIAQSECANGVKFANYWLHNGYIEIENKKMSKSLGNFFTVRQLADKFGYEVLRFMLVQAHYRAPINFSYNLIEQNKAALNRIKNFKSNLKFAIENSTDGPIDENLNRTLFEFKAKFLDALDNDFNTADAIAVIYDLIRATNELVSLKIETSKQNLIEISKIFNELIGVLKIAEGYDQNDEIPSQVLNLFKERNLARQNKNFELADKLRSEIESLGYCVEETKKGSRLILKETK